MRFALLGHHPDGLDLARALVRSGRHELAVYLGGRRGGEALAEWGIRFQDADDIEDVLADPSVDAVIVAGSPADRPAQLRRALQSERHVLCVHPADDTVYTAYEAAAICGDTGCVLLPLLPETLHPGVQRLVALLLHPDGPIGKLRVVEMERWSPETALLGTGAAIPKLSLPGWDVLRSLGGDIAEVSAVAEFLEVAPDEPLLVSGQFEGGGLFRVSFLSAQDQARWQLSVVGSRGRVELVFPHGWPNASVLSWRDPAGELHEERWDAWDPWPALVRVFDAALGQPRLAGPPLPEFPAPPAERSEAIQAGPPPPVNEAIQAKRRPVATHRATGKSLAHEPALTWEDEIRSLELDDAARRSVERRRATVLEYPEATAAGMEEMGFKGMMTLVGCATLLSVLMLFVLSAWVPWLGWLIVPVLVVFLSLQMLRWVIPAREAGTSEQGLAKAGQEAHDRNAPVEKPGA